MGRRLPSFARRFMAWYESTRLPAAIIGKYGVFTGVFGERVKGIEPSQPAWKAGALPLSYTRLRQGFGGQARLFLEQMQLIYLDSIPSQADVQTLPCKLLPMQTSNVEGKSRRYTSTISPS